MAFGDTNYSQEKAIYDLIAQCVEEIKHGSVAAGRPTVSAEAIAGMTSRFIGDQMLELTYHHYEVGDEATLARMKLDESGKKFVEKFATELKKKFKEKSGGKALKLDFVRCAHSPEMVSKLSGETSWLLSSTSRGSMNRSVGRFLIRDAALYKFSAKLDK